MPYNRLTKVFHSSIFHHVIELDHVSYRYPLAESSAERGDQKLSILALDDISLQLKEEESVAIIGSNGSGKTTLIKLLNALIVPNTGQVNVDELNTCDKSSQRSIRQKVGMVFQNPDNQIISTSVEREIAFGLENLALPHEEMKIKVERSLKYFNLEQYRNHAPHRLSGGEKQKVALAAVLSMQPEYLALDEPTSLLDPMGRKEVLALIRMMCEERNVTVIHVTQFPEEAAIADRVLVMYQGKILLDGSPLEVFRQEERLNQIGIDLPFPMRIASAFRRRGWSDLDDCLTMDSLVDNIVRHTKKHGLSGAVMAADHGPRTTDDRKRLELGERSTEDSIRWTRNNESRTTDGSQPQIMLKEVTYLYDQGLPTEKKALDRISLEIEKGDFIGLIGPTGSGKSTLAQHLNGLLLPSSGEVLIEGENIKDKKIDLKKIRQKVGLVFQFPELQLFEEAVYDDVAFGPKNLGLSKNEIDARVKEAIRKVGLVFEEFTFRSPFHLSGGEQRKVAIAGILALKPDVLVLDEPTSGLDGRSTQDITTLLKELNSSGVTIVMISHNMDLISQLAHKIVLLDQGRLLAFCNKEELFKDVDAVKSVGLDFPQTVELTGRLRDRGIQIEKAVFNEEELVELLCSGDL